MVDDQERAPGWCGMVISAKTSSTRATMAELKVIACRALENYAFSHQNLYIPANSIGISRSSSAQCARLPGQSSLG